ncbi:hypothetical protein ABZ484_10095 [Streptomyces sp. NPDC006393]|uniref:hypothetical protein n=1 Tax=Streptomyces sp. NPDC006393 TaxID=3156763 RepID=UPI0033C09CA1
MTGHIGRIGGRQVVAVLALGGGLLLGPVLSAQAAEDNAMSPGDTGPVPTALEAAHDLVSPVLKPDDGDHGGKGKGQAGEGHGKGKGHGKGEQGGKGHGKGQGKGHGKGKGHG